MSESVLRARGLTRCYGSIRAVDGIDLDINAGEFVVLLGPNGAGKTTLFQMLTGLFTPDAGTASIAGHDIQRQPVPALEALGVVFQQPTLDLTMSVIRNLRFHAKLHGMSRRKREHAIRQALADVNLTGQAHQRARNLSGGNRRKAELARALITGPQLLLMDEPSVGLDPASRRELLARVRRLCREKNVAVLWATHLVDEADDADRVVVLRDGRIAAEAAPAGLLATTRALTLSDAFHALTASTATCSSAPETGSLT